MKRHQKFVLLSLRIAIGFLFLYSGLDKLINGFTAEGYLINATSGPFLETFQSLAGSRIVDLLVIWGEILIGVSITSGLFLRFASSMGVLMMMLFYLSILPPEHGPINEHVIYSIVFILLASYGAGRHYGLDSVIERSTIIQGNHNIFKYLLG